MKADLNKLLKRPSSARKRGQLKKASALRADLAIKVINEDEQIVYGEVYAPYVIDSHGDMMLPEDVRKLAHRFLQAKKTDRIDIMHNNKPIHASMVESYIAKKGDPEYAEGAWVLAVKINDDAVWADIKAGKLNGYSLEAMVYKREAEVVFDYLPFHYGFTEENDGHFHAFFVEVDKKGNVIGGYSSEDADSDGVRHSHDVLAGTATASSNKHAHRYFLNEISDAD